jgi:hypothetical protein
MLKNAQRQARQMAAAEEKQRKRQARHDREREHTRVHAAMKVIERAVALDIHAGRNPRLSVYSLSGDANGYHISEQRFVVLLNEKLHKSKFQCHYIPGGPGWYPSFRISGLGTPAPRIAPPSVAPECTAVSTGSAPVGSSYPAPAFSSLPLWRLHGGAVPAPMPDSRAAVQHTGVSSPALQQTVANAPQLGFPVYKMG